MTARERVETLMAELARVNATGCESCGHSLALHNVATPGVCCATDFVPAHEGRVNEYGYRRVDCRCKRFVDPAETLGVTE